MLHLLKEAGVDTVGIHIESFDLDTLNRVAPAKAAIGLKRYEEAWKKAVELFGPNQVSSFVVVGLGEDPHSIISGSSLLADMGVYPLCGAAPAHSGIGHGKEPAPGYSAHGRHLRAGIRDAAEERAFFHRLQGRLRPMWRLLGPALLTNGLATL